VYGVEEDLFGNQFNSLKIRGVGGANNQALPDVLAKTDSTFNFSLTYVNDGTKPAAGWIEKSTGSKIIFWGFGFEGIVDTQSSISRTEILHTIFQWFDGSVDVPFNEQIVVSDFRLNQNYPNPFNPSTIISYQLPVKSFVSIKVFDILGKEVRTLVNEERDAGRYSFDFDGASLSSGIYFYQIKTGNFSDIKKMILMK
jgi:hypothetical protein